MVSLTDNLSLYSIIGMWVISYYPTIVTKGNIVKSARAFSNVDPRGNMSRLAEKKGLDPALVAKAARAEGAHLNGLEALPFFGIAVLAGNYAGIDNYTLNVACGFYLVTRMLFNYIYINNTTGTAGNIRSLVWMLSLGTPLYLLGKAGSLLANK